MNNTYRYLFIKRGKNRCINLNQNNSKNNLSSLKNRRKISERNFIIKNFNKLLLNPKKNKITQKKIMKIKQYLHLKIKMMLIKIHL